MPYGKPLTRTKDPDLAPDVIERLPVGWRDEHGPTYIPPELREAFAALGPEVDRLLAQAEVPAGRRARARAAILARDLERLGTVMEQSTFRMHATMHTATPPLLYWQPATVAALHAVFQPIYGLADGRPRGYEGLVRPRQEFRNA